MQKVSLYGKSVDNATFPAKPDEGGLRKNSLQ